MDEVTISNLSLPFKSMNDAPCHYGASEAEAWASGWNAAVEALVEAEKAARERVA